ncbi:MAG: histidine kinase dimerization/phosphoacceptor domain -containing protein, partial [Pseudomonadota bacterium]
SLAAASARGAEACQAEMDRLSARVIWRSATLYDAAGATDCTFRAPNPAADDQTTRVVHTLGEGRRVEALLTPLDLRRPVGLERGEISNFIDDWRPVAASPAWRLGAWPLGTDGGPAIFDGETDTRDAYRYALGPRDAYGVASVFAVPAADYFAFPRERLVSTMGLLLTILVLGILSAWGAMEFIVLRRLRAVEATAAKLAAGDLSARIPLDEDTPIELGRLGHSLNDMAERIEVRTREAERATAEQRRLLRELHHRVKNNFQVIGSLLSLQRRALPKEIGDVLRYPEDHVAAMATAYRISYASGEIAEVPLDELTSQIMAHLLRSTEMSASQLEGDVVVADVTVDLDSAVALGLLLTELLVPVFGEAARVRAPVRVDMLAGVAGLNVFIAGPAPSVEDVGKGGLPKRFMQAFCNQIDADMETHEEGPFYRARVRVPVERLTFTGLVDPA